MALAAFSAGEFHKPQLIQAIELQNHNARRGRRALRRYCPAAADDELATAILKRFRRERHEVLR
jgi:hypothetical protein